MEWLNYHHLYYFWTICREGGFSKAAAKLKISQSSVSLQLAKLEDHLGQQLMERGPRGFKLTEAGQITFAQAEEIFRQGQDLLQYFRSGKIHSHFRVGALSGLSKNLQFKILGKIISDSKVRLSLEVGDVPVLKNRLLNYQLDAVLSDQPILSSAAEPLAHTQIAAEPVCLVSRNKPKKSHAQNLSLGLAQGVYLPAQSSPIASVVMDFMTAAIKIPHIRGHIDDIAFLRLLALETDYLVAIPKIGVWREIQHGELYIVHEFTKIKQSYFLVYREKGKNHPMLHQLLKSGFEF